MNEIVKQEEKQIITQEKVIEYLDTFYANQLEPIEKKQFIEMATALNLNPFKKEIYCYPFNTIVMDYKTGQYQAKKILTIVVGYEVYLRRAEKIQKLDGWNIKIEGSIKTDDLKAIITIYRKDWKIPLEHEVYFSEYNKNQGLWKTKPITMLKKTVIAQGFRLAFPLEYEDIPYIEEELSDIRDITNDVNENEIIDNAIKKLDKVVNESNNEVKEPEQTIKNAKKILTNYELIDFELFKDLEEINEYVLGLARGKYEELSIQDRKHFMSRKNFNYDEKTYNDDMAILKSYYEGGK